MKAIGVDIMIAKQINVVIVDDHPGVRKGIRQLLGAAKDISVVGEGVNGEEAIKLATTTNPDIILLDVELPDLRGDVVMRRIHTLKPQMKVLAVSAYSERQYILGMMDSGASGYLTKEEVPVTLVHAIHSIINENKSWIGKHALKNSTLASIEEQTLTKREMEILEQLVHDLPESVIAVNLNMNESQVRKYLELLMRKFQIDSLSGLKLIGRRLFPES